MRHGRRLGAAVRVELVGELTGPGARPGDRPVVVDDLRAEARLRVERAEPERVLHLQRRRGLDEPGEWLLREVRRSRPRGRLQKVDLVRG